MDQKPPSKRFFDRVNLYFKQLTGHDLSDAYPFPQDLKKVVPALAEGRTSAKAVSRTLCAAATGSAAACTKPLDPSKKVVTTKPVQLQPVRPVVAAQAPAAASVPPRPASLPPPSDPPRVLVGVERTPAGELSRRPVFWEPAQQTNGFALVVGGSGSGKTELLRALAAETSRQNVPVIVLDLHGDLDLPRLQSYQAARGGIGINPLELSSKDPLSGGPQTQTEALLDAVRRAAPGFGRLQESALREVIQDAYRRAGLTEEPRTWTSKPPSLAVVQELLTAATKDPKRSSERRSLLGVSAAVSVAFADPVFRAANALSVANLVRSGGRVELDRLSRAAQVLVVDTLLRQVLGTLRSQGIVSAGRRYRVVVVLDEASLVKGAAILDLIFKEARKFGLALVLASQEPGDFSASVRANAATLYALRTNSAQQAQALAKELSLNPTSLLKLQGPGDGFVKDRFGTRRLQVLSLNSEERRALQ